MKISKNALLGLAGVITLTVSTVLLVKHYSKKSIPAQQQPTVEEVLRERAAQSSKSLVTPLGKALTEKNWQAARTLLSDPKPAFNNLAESVRAMFIAQAFNQYQAKDNEELLDIVSETLEKIDIKSFNHADLLITQFFRLPVLTEKTPAYERVTSWISGNTENQELKRIAVFKLTTQMLNPPSLATDAFALGITSGKTYGFSKEEWIRTIDDIRNIKIQDKMVALLPQKYDSFNTSEKAIALVTLSHHPDVAQKFTIKHTLSAYKSDDQATFEAALKSTKGLISQHLLSAQDEKTIVKILTHVSNQRKTPFVVAKIDELISLLTKK